MRRLTPTAGLPNLRSAGAEHASTSNRLADALRNDPARLQEMQRARMERNLVEAWRARSAHAVPLPRMRSSLSRGMWIGSIAASAALGVALAFFVLRRSESKHVAESPQAVAHFDLVIGDGAVQSGTL